MSNIPSFPVKQMKAIDDNASDVRNYISRRSIALLVIMWIGTLIISITMIDITKIGPVILTFNNTTYPEHVYIGNLLILVPECLALLFTSYTLYRLKKLRTP